MKKKIIVSIVVLVVVVGAVLGFTALKNGKGGNVKYRKEAIGRGDIDALVVTSGTLNPIDLVLVGSQVSGKITKLYADFNSQVKKGQIVAELDLDPLQMQVDQQQANYMSRAAALERAKVTADSLKNMYDRAQNLFNKNLLSYQDRETAEVNYRTAKADVTTADASLAQAKTQLDLSKVNLSYAIVKSPVDGTVIKRDVSVGQTVQASYQAPELFQVATDLTKMHVECDVDEADIGRVKEGQRARFTVEAFPNENFAGTVLQVRYASQTVSNVVTYTVVINVENPEKKLRPGMTATVSIVAGEAKNVLRVPNSALRFTPELPQAELDKIQREAMDRMRAQFQQQGGQTAGGPNAGGQQPTGVAGGQAQPGGQGGQGGQMGAGNRPAGQGGQRRQPSRVWLQDKNGKLSVLYIRAGITDNTYTEILRSDLKEGDEVLIGKAVAGTAATTSNQPGRPGGNMMFIGR